MNHFTSTLNQLDKLALLFKELSNGKHINRTGDASLWVALEHDKTLYQSLFKALGFELRFDERGFAWFHTDEISSNISKTSRQLALLFMVIFDTQADAGKPLIHFSDWIVDRTLLSQAFEKHQTLLIAENLDIDALLLLLESAARLGFTQQSRGHWQLLPAVCRYLDHFESLANQQRKDEVQLADTETKEIKE
ncbi:MAG: hypothetical protein DRQ61_08055 [Gammaproteobacteria bacterium]|nr:MAG: hypothetical protein DRQ56_10825 [Gammaproteobacteria bacterium]RLA21726.1 MAG: hypothetical protein DRQ61_08055 [Gammaproteobacteria bacterium]